MKSLALFLLLSLFVFGAAHTAQAEPTKSFSVGESLSFTSYCVGDDLEFIRKFTNVLVRYGIPAYRELVSKKDFPCYDSRIHTNLQFPISLTLVEKLWAFSTPEGERLMMWKVKDVEGSLGYGWTQVLSSSGALHEKVTTPMPGQEV